VVWSRKISKMMTSSPALVKQREKIFVSIGDSLLCLNWDGQLLWSRKFKCQISHPVPFSNGRVYLTDSEKLICWSFNGDSVWVTGTLGGGFYNSAPAVDQDGYIYVTTLGSTLGWYDFKVFRCDPNGNKSWEFEYLAFEPGGVQMTPAVADSKIFFATKVIPYWSSSFYCLTYNASGPYILWDRDAKVHYTSSAIDIARQRIYYCDGGNGRLQALTLSGSWLWQQSSGVSTYSSPVLDGSGKIFVGNDAGIITVLGSNGNIIYQYDTKAGPLGSPVIADNKIYICSTSGKLFCFGWPIDRRVPPERAE